MNSFVFGSEQNIFYFPRRRLQSSTTLVRTRPSASAHAVRLRHTPTALLHQDEDEDDGVVVVVGWGWGCPPAAGLPGRAGGREPGQLQLR